MSGGEGRAGRCPICGAPEAAHFHPFCSRRCAHVDLNRWLSGVYRVPAVEQDDDDNDTPAPDDADRRRDDDG